MVLSWSNCQMLSAIARDVIQRIQSFFVNELSAIARDVIQRIQSDNNSKMQRISQVPSVGSLCGAVWGGFSPVGMLYGAVWHRGFHPLVRYMVRFVIGGFISCHGVFTFQIFVNWINRRGMCVIYWLFFCFLCQLHFMEIIRLSYGCGESGHPQFWGYE